jgi:ferritin-like metal-binding protein YciE
MKISSLLDLYLDQLRELFDAEQQLRKALAAAAKAATSQELKDALEEHIDQGEEHASRLKEILDGVEGGFKPKRCVGMAGLISELNELLESDIEPETLDSGIILCAQRIDHYEIAAYGCLCAWARLMGHEEDADILQESLDEEKESDEILTDIADTTVNHEAHEGEVAGDGDEPEEDKEKEEEEEEEEEGD